MKITKELEESLLELEKQNIDNQIYLTEFSRALEETYNAINNCLLKEEKSFYYSKDALCRCEKKGYDASKGKTIYEVCTYSQSKKLFNIEVDNNGVIGFDIETPTEEITRIINILNQPSCGLLEKIRINAEVSFFTENREVILSEEPYLAIKIGNFTEGNESVLLFREQTEQNNINKTNLPIRYIRFDQINGYLSKIKIDERKIPFLAYAFLQKGCIDNFLMAEKLIMKQTYPNLTEEKIEKIQSRNELDVKLSSGTAAIVTSIFSIFGLAYTPVPFLANLAISIGLPTITALGINHHDKVNRKRALNKPALLTEAKENLYVTMKKMANEKQIALEKKFSFERNQIKSEENPIKQKNLDPKEIIDTLKKILYTPEKKEKIYFSVLKQFENAYGLVDKSIVNQEMLEDENLYQELLQLSDDVYKLGKEAYNRIFDNAFNLFKRTIYHGEINKTIENLNLYTTEYISSKIILSDDEIDNMNNDLANLYLKAIFYSIEKNGDYSIGVIDRIPNPMKGTINKKIISYIEQHNSMCQNQIIFNNKFDARTTTLASLIDKIYENDLVYDLIGEKVKVSESKIKVKSEKEGVE